MATTRLGRDFSTPHEYRDDNLRTDVVSIYDQPCNLYGWNIINPNSTNAYVKFYDTVSPVVIGTSTVAKTLLIPANSTVVMGSATGFGNSQMVVQTGLRMAVTTELADSGTTAPTLAVYAEIYYRE